MKLFAAAATALTLATGVANASSFDILVETGPTFTGPGAALYLPGELFVDDDTFTVSIFALIASDGTFDPADSDPANLIFADSTTSFSGELSEVAFDDDTMFALFDTADAVWGDLVRATIDFDFVDWSGGVDLADVTTATVTLDAVAPIPLPATLPLLAGGIGLIAVARRRAA